MDSVPLPTTRHLAIRLRLRGECRLPAFFGPELRGMLGQGLKRAFCEARSVVRQACPACPPELAARCAYARLFEPRAESGGGEPPRPFVLAVAVPARAEQRFSAGSVLDLGLTILGPAVAESDRFVAALVAAGAEPLLGRGRRARFEVESVATEPADRDAASAGWFGERLGALARAPRMRLRLSSPLALRQSKRTLAVFDLDSLVRHAGERLSRLASAFPPAVDAPRIDLPNAAASGARVAAARTSRFALERRGRGGHRQPMEGIVGEVALAGELERILPLLVAIERLHVGRHTTSGFGRIELGTPCERAGGETA